MRREYFFVYKKYKKGLHQNKNKKESPLCGVGVVVIISRVSEDWTANGLEVAQLVIYIY
jgi:hypothetical protein